MAAAGLRSGSGTGTQNDPGRRGMPPRTQAADDGATLRGRPRWPRAGCHRRNPHAWSRSRSHSGSDRVPNELHGGTNPASGPAGGPLHGAGQRAGCCGVAWCRQGLSKPRATQGNASVRDGRSQCTPRVQSRLVLVARSTEWVVQLSAVGAARPARGAHQRLQRQALLPAHGHDE